MNLMTTLTTLNFYDYDTRNTCLSRFSLRGITGEMRFAKLNQVLVTAAARRRRS